MLLSDHDMDAVARSISQFRSRRAMLSNAVHDDDVRNGLRINKKGWQKILQQLYPMLPCEQ